MNDLLDVILLGIVQGLTEFLPISSSGHLVVLEYLLDAPDFLVKGVGLEVALHVGTLLAVLLYYREDLMNVFRLASPRPASGYPRTETFALLKWILVGSIPTVVLAILFKDWFESCFENPMQVGIALCVTGMFCLASRFIPCGKITITGLGPWRAILIGVAQGFAIIPGISRSGATIVTGIWLGVDPKEAARYSFLLSVPAILGAAALKLAEGKADGGLSLWVLLPGILASAVVGYLCLGLLTRILNAGGFYYFGYYCVPLGLFVLYYCL